MSENNQLKKVYNEILEQKESSFRVAKVTRKSSKYYLYLTDGLTEHVISLGRYSDAIISSEYIVEEFLNGN